MLNNLCKIYKILIIIFLLFICLPVFSNINFGGIWNNDLTVSNYIRYQTQLSLYLGARYKNYFRFYTQAVTGFYYRYDFDQETEEIVSLTDDEVLYLIKPYADFDQFYIRWALPRKDKEELKTQGGETNFDLLVMRAGRFYVNQGSGLLFSGNGDGLDIQFNIWNFKARVFGLYSGLFFFRETDNSQYFFTKFDLAKYNDNVPVTDRFYGRAFSGLTLSLINIFYQNFYLMGLVQYDFIPEHALYEDDKSNKNLLGGQYNSAYAGAGVQGKIYRNLYYLFEFIYESGESRRNLSEHNMRINAIALTTQVKYFIPVILNPSTYFAFGFASGDQNTVAFIEGNSKGEDNQFRSPGLYKTGFIAGPVLSNSFIFNLGFTIQPLNILPIDIIKNITVVTDFYYYLKHESNSQISVSGANQNHINVGFELNQELIFPLFSDLNAGIKWGLFVPGQAFLNEIPTGKFSLRLSHNF